MQQGRFLPLHLINKRAQRSLCIRFGALASLKHQKYCRMGAMVHDPIARLIALLL